MLSASLDIFLEKPLAHTLESTERIADAARAAEGFCMVGYNNGLTLVPDGCVFTHDSPAVCGFNGALYSGFFN